MKELIEKIKNKLGFENTTFSIKEKELIDIGLKDAIRILEKWQEEETKPFDPELLGFTRYHLDSNEYIKLINDWKEYYILTLHKEIDPQPFLMMEVIGYGGKRKVSFGPVNIPSHRFGVELLKNLGVIE